MACLGNIIGLIISDTFLLPSTEVTKEDPCALLLLLAMMYMIVERRIVHFFLKQVNVEVSLAESSENQVVHL